MMKWLIVLLSLVMPVAHALEENLASPLGLWKTIDDVTGKPRAIVELYQDQQHQLYGKILKVYATPEEKLHKVCVECKGEKHNQPILGLVFLEKLKQAKKDKVVWAGGKILDPKTGREYHCNMRLTQDGKQLNVRGYIGLPLFGRSQKWVRV